MNHLRLFLLMSLTFCVVEIQGYKSACPFATLHKTTSQDQNEILYQKALKLEQMTKGFNKLVQRDTIDKDRLKRSAIQPYVRRFPIRNRYSGLGTNRFRTYYPSRSRYYVPSARTYYPVESSFTTLPGIINKNAKKEEKNESPIGPETSKGTSQSSKLSTKLIDIQNENIQCSLEQKEAVLTCELNHPYRSFSGRCNNLDTNMNFGKHSNILKRLLPSEYDDGISHPRRKNIKGGMLPNPRLISSTVHHDSSNLDQRYTLALMQWGQFLDHDITLTPFIDPLAKCEEKCHLDSSNNLSPTTVIGPCYSIPVPVGDSFFPSIDEDSKSGKCLPLIRSLPAQKNIGPRDQMNAITAYIDASNLYGSDPCMSEELRQHEGGLLKDLKHPMSPSIFKSLMPRHAHHPECRSPTGKCFMTGDDRNSEQPGLVSMHTMMMREHNRIAKQIALENPDWNDERVFQEARKIVVAINQHITYNEFLPRVLGPDLMKHFELELQAANSGDLRFNGYDSTCSADIYNEFASAAFRFGHSLIRSGFDMVPGPNATTPLTKHIELKDHFFQPDMTFGIHVVDELLRGMVTSPMASFDRAITKEVTEHLFEKKGTKYSGQDLATLNIQRAREHGIPSYSKYHKLCSNILPDSLIQPELKAFDDLSHIMDDGAIKALSSVYDSVDDIDLFPGGLSETPLPGGIVGRTFGCVIGLQFQKLRKCDRFWYETPDTNIGFTDNQLKEIKQVTLSSIMCRSWDVNSGIQKWAFDMQHPISNPTMECSESYLPTIDMQKFWNKSPIGRSKILLPKSCDIGGRIVKVGEEKRISACTICSCSLQGNIQCYSDVVKSCKDLTKEFGRSAIAADLSCQAQCPDIIFQADAILSVAPIVPA